jgi:hypothetical protein
MTDEAMSPLRRRMTEDMTIRKLAPKTQQGYIRSVKDFAAFLGRSPDTTSFEDVRRFQLHLAASGAHIPILRTGRLDEARASCAVVMQIDPSQRVSGERACAPFQRPQDLQKLREAYRTAGMPE